MLRELLESKTLLVIFAALLAAGLIFLVARFMIPSQIKTINMKDGSTTGKDIPAGESTNATLSAVAPIELGIINDYFDKKNTSKILLPPENGLYLGAFADFGQNEDKVTKDKISEFQNLIGKKITWAYFSNNWFQGINFPSKEVDILSELGITPYIRLMPRKNFSNRPDEQIFTLERIAKGDFDAEIENWAKSADKSGIPIILEFGTEVNGDWYPWNGRWNGRDKTDFYGDPELPDGSEKFIDAYRHIIEIFRKLKVNNVTWIYHISSHSSPDKPWNNIMSYYPGDAYIDWIGVSVYGAQSSNEDWITFDDKFAKTYWEITESTDKPVIIAELGVSEGSKKNMKAEWLKDSLSSLNANNYPKVKGVSFWHSAWLNEDGTKSNLRVDSSKSALDVLKESLFNMNFQTDAVFTNPNYNY